MLDHHLQRSIIYKLAFADGLKFSELKPDDIENKLFTYHLKKTLSSGYVQKLDSGVYTLTPNGRRLSTGVMEKQNVLITERPLSALFLIVRRSSDKHWLLYKRKTHPVLGLKGFMHARPNAGENILKTASDTLLQKTGLSGSFSPLGGGYVRLFKNDDLESFTHFTLLYCEDASGDLVPADIHAEYYWEAQPNFESSEMFPTTALLKDMYDTGKPFFVDKTYYL